MRITVGPTRLAPILVGLLSSCGEADVVYTGFTVRDSAGIMIAESLEPAWGESEGWTLSAEPILDIGTADGGAGSLLDQVRNATRTLAGNVLVANNGSHEVRVFDPEGRFLRAFGGEGEGPGEFQDLARIIVRSADSVLVLDDWQRRATLFDTSGSIAWTASVGSGGGARANPTAALGDGSFVWASERMNTPAEVRVGGGAVISRSEVRLVRYASDGTLMNTLGVFPGAEMAHIRRRDGGTIVGQLLLGRRMSYAAGGDRVYVGTGESYEVRAYHLDGSLAGIVRRRGVDLTVTEAAADSAKRDFLRAARPGLRESYDEILSLLPLPDQRAPFGDLMVDANAHLWVSDYHPGSYPDAPAPTGWSVFNPEGRWLGRVTLPEGFYLFEIGDDYVLGLGIDELGVEHVRMYGLTRD